MTYDELIGHFGSQKKAADALGLAQPSVWQWRRDGIPDVRQLEIERATEGKLRADAGVRERFLKLLGTSDQAA